MVSIRPATEQDLDAILQIEAQSFPSPWDRFAFQFYLQMFPSLFFVYTEDETVIGYIIASIHRDKNQNRLGHIDSIAVLAPFRRQGIGRQLMNRLFKALKVKGCQEALLLVRVSNAIAQQFYRSFGFQVKSQLKGYYDGEDGLVMAMEVEE